MSAVLPSQVERRAIGESGITLTIAVQDYPPDTAPDFAYNAPIGFGSPLTLAILDETMRP